MTKQFDLPVPFSIAHAMPRYTAKCAGRLGPLLNALGCKDIAHAHDAISHHLENPPRSGLWDDPPDWWNGVPEGLERARQFLSDGDVLGAEGCVSALMFVQSPLDVEIVYGETPKAG